MDVARVLMVGDIAGEIGVATVVHLLPALREELALDFVIANGENMHQGRGFNEVMCKRLLKAGVDVLTGGDHSFDKHLIFPYMAKERRLLRPYNYPPGAPGYGYGVYEVPSIGMQAAVINMRGQTFFSSFVRCPFFSTDQVLENLEGQTGLIFIDFHAEATAEKLAYGRYVDGRAGAVAGTHTHVQTADEQVFANGTGYITDLGFTGAQDGVIGMSTDLALRRFRLQTPQKYEGARRDPQLLGALFEINRTPGEGFGRCVKVTRVRRAVDPETAEAMAALGDE